MPELTLAPQNLFVGLVLPDVAGVTLLPSPIRHRLAFQVDSATVEAGAMEAGFPALPACLRATIVDRTSLLRLGPDEWLLLGEAEFSALMREMAGSGAIELSHGYAGIVWNGPRTMLALAAGCPLDMHLRAFPRGMVTRTLYGKCDIVLWRQEEQRFYMEVPRSYLAAILGFFAQTAQLLPAA